MVLELMDIAVSTDHYAQGEIYAYLYEMLKREEVVSKFGRCDFLPIDVIYHDLQEFACWDANNKADTLARSLHVLTM